MKKFRVFNTIKYSLLMLLPSASLASTPAGIDSIPLETPAPVKEVSLDNTLRMAVDSATPSELEQIEDGLANLKDMTVQEKEELRAFIMKIALREDASIFQLEEKYRRQKITQNYIRQMHDLFSVSPDMIKKSREHSLKVEKALHEPLKNVNERIMTIEYDINSNTPIPVPLAPGMVNQLVFFDNTGAPWAITDTSEGNGFTIDVRTESNNVVTINTDKLFSVSNAAIFLKGLNYSVPLALQSNLTENTTRLTIRMKQRSPDSKVVYQPFEKVIDDDDSLLMLANGYPPAGASPLQINLPNTEAWVVGDYYYIRSEYKLNSPGAINQRVSQTAGVSNVYKIFKSSVLYFGVDWQSKPFKVVLNDYAVRAMDELQGGKE